MANKPTADVAENAPLAADKTAAGDHAAVPPRAVRFASGEKVSRATEKVFRLHARLFEELAK